MRVFLRNLDRSLGKALTTLIGITASVRHLADTRSPKPIKAKDMQAAYVPSRILAIKLVGLGDTVLMLTAIDRLKKSLPKAEVFVLATPVSKGLIDGQPQIDQLITFDPLSKTKAIREMISLIGRLRKLRIDCIIDFEQHFQSTAILSYLVGAPRRIGLYYHGNPRRMLLTDPIFLNPDRHMLESYLKLLEPLAIDSGHLGELTPIHVDQADRNMVEQWLSDIDNNSRFAGIHAGSGIRTPGRRWSIEGFAEITRRLRDLGMKVLLTGSPAEYQRCERIRCLAGCDGVFNCAGTFTIKQTAYLISKCSLYVSNDTGPMHVAAAMGVPTVGLFGPQLPQRYAPWGKRNRWVYRGAPCSPCVEIHKGLASKCKNPICMQSITVEDVWNAIVSVLQTQTSL